MPEVVCNTSPIQYLHQLGLLNLLPEIGGSVIVPAAVVKEIDAGRRLGLDLPDLRSLPWSDIRQPLCPPALVLAHDLGEGERGVLCLCMETPGAIAILDDGLARRAAMSLGIPMRGTLGLLLDAKKLGLVVEMAPILASLSNLGFRVSQQTRCAILEAANETQ